MPSKGLLCSDLYFRDLSGCLWGTGYGGAEIQERDDGGLAQGGSNEMDTNGWIWHFFLEVEPRELVEGLDCRSVKESWIKDGFWVCGLNNSADVGAINTPSNLFFSMILHIGTHFCSWETRARWNFYLMPKATTVGEDSSRSLSDSKVYCPLRYKIRNFSVDEWTCVLLEHLTCS